MDFIVEFGLDLPFILQDLENVRVGARAFKPALIKNKLGRFSCIATSDNFNDKEEMFTFDGQVSVGGNFFHTLSVPPSHEQLVDIVPELIRSKRFDATGIYTCATVEKNSAVFRSDILSAAPLYYYLENGNWAISNRIGLLARALEQGRIPLTRTIDPSIQNIVFGTTFNGISPFREIKVLEFNKMIVVEDTALQLVDLDAYDPIPHTYDECIENGRKSILSYVESVKSARQDWHSTTDVTGGADSRCVLAFLLNSSFSRNLYGRCITKTPHPDAVVANNIMRKYGIAFGRHPIVTYKKSTLTDEIAVRMNAELTGGGRDSGAPVPSVGLENFLHFKGSYGEIGGATPGVDYAEQATHLGEVDIDRMLDLWIERRRKVGALELLTDGAIDNARSAARREIVATLDCHIQRDQLQSELYLRTRARTHFGLSSHFDQYSKTTIEPLANFWLVAAKRKASNIQINANKIIFDLTYANNPELTMEPFANKSWSKSVLPDCLKSVAPVTGSECEAGLSSYKPIHINGEIPDGFEPLSQGKVGGDRSRFATAGSTASYQALLQSLLDRLDANNNVWDTFDHEAFKLFSDRALEDFSSHGIDTNVMGVATAGVLSVLGETCRPRISSVATVRVTETGVGIFYRPVREDKASNITYTS